MKFLLGLFVTVYSFGVLLGQDNRHLSPLMRSITLMEPNALADRHNIQQSLEERNANPCLYDSTHTYDYMSATDSVLSSKVIYRHDAQTAVVRYNYFEDDEIPGSLKLSSLDSNHFFVYPDLIDFSASLTFDTNGEDYFAYRNYFRNTDGLIDSTYYYTRDMNGLLEPTSKFTYVYDINDKLTLSTNFSYDLGMPTLVSRTLYTYDAAGRISTLTSESYNNGQYSVNYLTSYTYTDDENYEIVINYGVNSTSNRKIVYVFDAASNRRQIYEMNWNTDTQGFTDTSYYYAIDNDALDRRISLLTFNSYFSYTDSTLYNYIGESNCRSYHDQFVLVSEDLGFIRSSRQYYFVSDLSSTFGQPFTAADLRISPNPSDGTLFVEAPEGELITISDMQGRHLWQGVSTGNTRVDLPQYYQGMVLVRVGRVVKKAVIHRG
jgi:hypothetical protein